jgi:hypothetical protein
MTKQYHTLIARDGIGEAWGIEFGSFVRAEVEFERQDYRDHGRKASDLKIVTCAAGQAAIDAVVAKLNAAPVTVADLVAAVRKHAVANYERGGWDFLVECWEDQEIVEAIGAARTVEGAIRNVARGLGLLDERRREVQSFAF